MALLRSIHANWKNHQSTDKGKQQAQTSIAFSDQSPTNGKNRWFRLAKTRCRRASLSLFFKTSDPGTLNPSKIVQRPRSTDEKKHRISSRTQTNEPETNRCCSWYTDYNLERKAREDGDEKATHEKESWKTHSNGKRDKTFTLRDSEEGNLRGAAAVAGSSATGLGDNG